MNPLNLGNNPFKTVREQSPLIHVITNPISINDCANVILSLGGKPIMAEHPGEVAEITAQASALALNLGNITDVRMESMKIAYEVALARNIPTIIDMVGIGVSTLRQTYLTELLNLGPATVLKGNMSEMKALLGLENDSIGIDAGEGDRISPDNLTAYLALAREVQKRTKSTVAISGETDILAGEKRYYFVENGIPALSLLTGTGCMLNCIMATYLPLFSPLEATLLGTLILTIAGELAEDSSGMGSFHVALLNAISKIDEETIQEKMKITGGVFHG